MKRFIKLTLAVAMTMISTSLYAQKLARINMQEIVSVMPEFKEMQTNLETFGKDLQEQLEQIQVEFNNKAADFQKNQATMAESVKQFKQQELEQLQNRYMEFQRVAQSDYQNKSNELFEPVQKKAMEAVSKVAKAGGYTAVFDTSAMGLAFYDEALLTAPAAAVNVVLCHRGHPVVLDGILEDLGRLLFIVLVVEAEEVIAPVAVRMDAVMRSVQFPADVKGDVLRLEGVFADGQLPGLELGLRGPCGDGFVLCSFRLCRG